METIDKSAYARYIAEQQEVESAERRQKLVKELLDKLPESERTVMTLYYLGEMKTREISRFLGVSVNTITSRLQRARRRLRQDETVLVQEMLGSVQLSANLAENITQKAVDMKPMPAPATKPVIPWIAVGAAAILMVLMQGKPHHHNHEHYWYDFWDAPLGRPVGEKGQLYHDSKGYGVKGLFIRAFTNGWAVYNRSGKEQKIRLPKQAFAVASGLTGIQHILSDLDGEIYK